MHQLQWGMCSNRTEGSPRQLSLKCLAVQAFPHYGVAILGHHGPPEPLLSESQGPLLALMAGIAMYPVKHQLALTHGNDEGQHSLCLTFGVMFMYMRSLFRMRLLRIWKNILPCSILASTPRHSFRRVSCLGGDVPFLRWSHLQHPARATSTSWACSQSTMYIGSSFAT